jgi:hypothetical protein
VLRVVERETAQLLTHQLAVNCAIRVLTGWQQMLRANTHWRQHTLRGCLTYWSWWAPDHRARNAGGQEKARGSVQLACGAVAAVWQLKAVVLPTAGENICCVPLALLKAVCLTIMSDSVVLHGHASAAVRSRLALAACFIAGWRAAAQELAARKLARCFYCWRWYCQVRLLREVAFQNKQRAIREALAIGEQVARRRKAALLASCFMAWHIQVGAVGFAAHSLLPGVRYRSSLPSSKRRLVSLS